jgi:hypothetical protein
MSENTYWNNNGTHQVLISALEKMIPAEGAVESPRKNRALEKFRRAANCYYDLYNNGLCNRAGEFYRVFGIRSSQHRTRWNHWFAPLMFVEVEKKMDEIVLSAAREQNIVSCFNLKVNTVE